MEAFFSTFYARRPVTATYTGLHQHDHALPDWSPEGLVASIDEMRAMRRDLEAAGRTEDADVCRFPHEVDLALADGCLEIQIAEHARVHFYRRNPALWTGEAVFGILSLLTRPFAPIDARLAAATARGYAVPAFLSSARATLESAPDEWRARALRECDAAEILFARSLPAWLRSIDANPIRRAAAGEALAAARDAFRAFARWLRTQLPSLDGPCAAGEELLELLLRRGHWCDTPIPVLADEARLALDEAHDQLAARVEEIGADSWHDVEGRIASVRPTADDYLARFERTWQRFRDAARQHDLVTWPDAPIRYVPIPQHTREAAPLLYYLFYRSPAAFDRHDVYDYVVPPIDGLPAEELDRRLAAANDTAIALNHVVHHGGLGHHVQNWYAYRSLSRIGQVAAIDAASRIAMFCGGSLAEGWACYACDLMEEVGALTPLERAAQQHTRVRLAARAVADLALHTGRMSLEDAASFYTTRGLMTSRPPRGPKPSRRRCSPARPSCIGSARAASTTCARASAAAREARSTYDRFHDRFLRYGAIPVALIARLMTNSADASTLDAVNEDNRREARRAGGRLLCRCSVDGVLGCARGPAGPGPSNDLLIVGYDREPDTLNRFSTHILEDIQTCVIEGLTITDEKMNVIPLLAAEVPTLENGGVVAQARWRHGRDVEAATRRDAGTTARPSRRPT